MTVPSVALIDPLKKVPKPEGLFDSDLAKEVVKPVSRQVRRQEERVIKKAGGVENIKNDFRVFLTLLWRRLGLPDPTELQLDVAYYMQHHPRSGITDRLIIMAFRGMAKSWITGAFVLWSLYRNPQLKIGVYSGSATRSRMFVTWCLTLVREWPLLSGLVPSPNQRQSNVEFDVGPATPDQTPSVFSKGITAATVGYRGDIIVGDDVETNANSMTPDMREKLKDATKEFDSIIKPGGQIIFLGTPQTEASIYGDLEKRGYVVVLWPVRYPTTKQKASYGHRLAPYIRHKMEQNPRLVGKSTEPTRFTDEDLAERETSQGKTDFALQFMLDTSLSDIGRYPLRLSELIVMSLDRERGPDTVSWGSDLKNRLDDIQPIALDGDYLYGPASVSESSSKYQDIRAFIDPSGTGQDETTLTIAGVLHSRPFVLKQSGWSDGFSPETLTAIAELLVAYRVSRCDVEEDFGQGMFAPLLEPYVKTAWDEFKKRFPQEKSGIATEIETVRSEKRQKELRILAILEPLFNAHRLVIAKEVFESDYEDTMARDGTEMRDRHSLMHQITRLTRERDCLTHDDRVEGLAGVCGMFSDYLGLMPEDAAKRAEEKRIEEELEKYLQEEEYLSSGSKTPKKAARGRLGRVGHARAGGRR